MSDQIEISSEYPDALSIYPFEGGYTFLHRVFEAHFETKKPVVINTGGLFIEYKFEPHHKAFAEGIRVLKGDNQEAWNDFMECAGKFSLDMAFRENGIDRPTAETRSEIDDLLDG
tara:strand:+ start:1647 stop:1991 length:345 start_codon:yes stop_codon:yes gene_type:complete